MAAVKVLWAGVVSLLVAAATTLAQSGGPPPVPADLIVVNGKVVTADSAFRMAEAVAVRQGRIVAVGTYADVRALTGPSTRIVDASGRTVVPGLIDTHVHALMAGPAEAGEAFRTITSIPDLQEWTRGAVARAPADAWVWTPRVYPTRFREHRFPTRAELDAASAGRPVAVDMAYATVLNSAALAAAGITADTPDPPGGAIVRDADGTPTGQLRNVGRLLARFRPRVASATPLDHVEALHRAYLATGITSVIERGGTVEGYRLYESLKAEGRLRLRATVTLMVPGNVTPEQAAGAIDAIPLTPRAGDDWLKVGSLKLTVDGGILLGTSYMREPYGAESRELYGKQASDYRGFLSVSPEVIRAVMVAGHAKGWQMSAHVTGDAGVDAVLDAFEAAQKAHPRPDARHTLIHAYFPTPDTARRVSSLGVQVDTQPAWFYKDADALLGALGERRLAHFIGLRTWRDAGVRVAINTDHMFGADRDTSMNPFNPFLTMSVAVRRRTEAGVLVGAEEAVTREQALRMMTSDAAALSFDERNRGSLEVGKLADLVVLSDDVLTCPEERLPHIKADITIVNGAIAYQR